MVKWLYIKIYTDFIIYFFVSLANNNFINLCNLW